MEFYSRFFFPRLCDYCMSMSHLDEYRQTLLADVEGDVLEIGFGTGLNLPHYPSNIQKLTAVDVNPGMNAIAKERIRDVAITVDHRVLSGERLPMEDRAFDHVVSTWTLCSIKDVKQALREIRRVLKPDGRFFFIEHGLSDDPKIQRWQNLLTPLQKRIGDGCSLNRNMRTLIEEQDFGIIELDEFYMEKAPKTYGYTYRGVAAK